MRNLMKIEIEVKSLEIWNLILWEMRWNKNEKPFEIDMEYYEK